MSGKGSTILIGVVALIIGAVGGVVYGMMVVDEVNQKLVAVTQERDQAVQNAGRLRKLNDEAAKKYGQNLGKLVVAVPAADEPVKLIDSARMILAARDGYRASLDGVRASMNSEFDALAAELGNATQDVDKVKQLLDGLKQNWPAKEKGMEDASRRLLVELGVLQAAPAPKPQATPAAAPPAPAPADKKY